ncbi:PilZ domain-containing protein [Sphingomonas sp. QA11]|uniref:PilZ domain-containing protein n=1 Tax=Sphingomonas sp. QA11 TaxID=2950605 RepID=UPI00234BC086|nr:MULTISPECIES: PilZ domain-containing protein [unclassified Sphingomonas]WCM28883.1 PilZ domain-containing protein [Sphingomonas sp. QA11]WEK01301.1 MAG: PilZ domain-containing protein [Sphingomonas sp.]
MFAAEFEPAMSNGRRRSPRAPVSLDARIGRGGFDRALCKVTDVSLHGARLHTYSSLRKGSMIWLTLPRLGQVAATIMWADDFEAGCQFQHPLDDGDFATLVDHGMQPQPRAA